MIKNQIVTQSWANSDTASSLSDIFNYVSDAFSGFNGLTVTSSADTLNVFFDAGNKLKMTITANASGGLVTQYYLNGTACAYSENTYSTSTNPSTRFSYLRTDYGIMWIFKAVTSSTDPTVYSDFTNIFTVNNTPTLFLNLNMTAGTLTTCTEYIMSAKHQQIESTSYRCTANLNDSAGNARFAMCNAYACDVDLNLRHLYRVLTVPASDYAKGKVIVRDKKIFYCGRYALEYEEE